MDILYQLPLPDVVCSKIFGYACKSPHIGLSATIVKKLIGLDIYNTLMGNGGIVLDGDGNVVEFLVWKLVGKGFLLDNKELKLLTFDIAHLTSLPNLTKIGLFRTGVTGDIIHLKSLSKLTEIDLRETGVTGDIVHMKSLRNLTEIDLSETAVTGDIIHLKSQPSLTEIWLSGTGVTGDENAFDGYRETAGLPDCYIY